MIASFVLSRTLVPTMAMYLLKPHAGDHEAGTPVSRNPLVHFQRGFEARFEAVSQVAMADLLERALAAGGRSCSASWAVVALSFLLIPFLGQNFFPSGRCGQITMHVRAPIGSRIEEHVGAVRPDRASRPSDHSRGRTGLGGRQYRPAGQLDQHDLQQFGHDRPAGRRHPDPARRTSMHAPTADYVRKLRETLPGAFPGATFSFLPADITSQILNFGAPAPIDVQITGKDMRPANRVRDEAAAQDRGDPRRRRCAHPADPHAIPN